MESLDKLEEMIKSFPPTYNLIKIAMLSQVKQAKQEFEDYQSRSITWSTLDFESRAKQLEKENWRDIYNEELFKENLEIMISQHDATLGITWDTIDVYLEYCKR